MHLFSIDNKKPSSLFTNHLILGQLQVRILYYSISLPNAASLSSV